MIRLWKWLGFVGVSKDDGARAQQRERSLRWVIVLALLLVYPAFFFEFSDDGSLADVVANVFYAIALVVLVIHEMVIFHASEQRLGYLRRNWMNVFIAVGLSASLWTPSPIATFEWGWHVGFLFVLSLRLARTVRRYFSRSASLYVLALAALVLGGAGFYWLEPSTHSYDEGLWLAFTTAATVGYGDVVPTTASAKIFAVIVVLFGYGVISVITARIAAFFVEEEDKKLRREMHADMKALREEIRRLHAEIEKNGKRAADPAKGAEGP